MARTAPPGVHSFTGDMCAGARAQESRRSDRLFHDPAARVFAGRDGLTSPMGAWILVPRTRFGDDLVAKAVLEEGVRQLVVLGAGMDGRAWRLDSILEAAMAEPRAGEAAALAREVAVFEVDFKATFDKKEPLVAQVGPLKCKSRRTVAADLGAEGQPWAQQLVSAGFDKTRPAVFLIEGLVYYLPHDRAVALLEAVTRLAAPGSTAFHDSISATYVLASVTVAGAPFVSGSDDYPQLWGDGWTTTVLDHQSIGVDRARGRLLVDYARGRRQPQQLAGRQVVLFVQAKRGDR